MLRGIGVSRGTGTSAGVPAGPAGVVRATVSGVGLVRAAQLGRTNAGRAKLVRGTAVACPSGSGGRSGVSAARVTHAPPANTKPPANHPRQLHANRFIGIKA